MAAENGFDLSALNNELGAYHRQHHQVIEEKLLYGHETGQHMTTIPSTIDQKAMAKGEMSEVSQAFNAKVTYKGDYKLSPNIVKTDDVMLAYRFVPKVLRKSWAGYLVQNRLTQQQLPFINYMVSKCLKQFIHEHETKHIAKGYRKEPVDGVAGAAINAMTGFITRGFEGMTKGKIIPVDIGGFFNRDTIGDYVSNQIWKIPHLYRTSGDLMCLMSTDNAQAYNIATGQDNNIQFVYSIPPNFDPKTAVMPQVPQGQTHVKGTTIPVIGLPSFGDSNLIMFVNKNNLKKAFDENSLQFEPLQYDDFYVKVLASMNVGTGFTWDELVWVCGSLSETPIITDITSVTNSSFELNWETAWGSSGYEIDVSPNADFSGGATTSVNGMETLNQAITGLSANTTYYIRQRSKIQRESSTDKYLSFNSQVRQITTAA